MGAKLFIRRPGGGYTRPVRVALLQTRLRLVSLLWALVAAPSVHAQPVAPAVDTLDPLLATLAGWCGPDQESAYGYTAVASGAALAAGYGADAGYHLPARLKLLWPGNVCRLSDSTYVPARPESVARASQTLLAVLKTGRGALLINPSPLYVYGADTSFGDPWFFVVSGGNARPDTGLWDSGDLKRDWWLWSDDPGANTIWPRPAQVRAPRGRRAVLEGLKQCVLAARPNTGVNTSTGLAAFEVTDVVNPGKAAELRRIAAIRLAASAYLGGELELWPPAEREPIKLAVYYLQKSAQAWSDLADRASDWALLSAERREELLSALRSHETSAALAFDALVSPAPE
jgi:hypothetical protein